MVAHVANSFASRIKIWDQNEAMNLNRNEIIIILRVYLSENWAETSYEFVIIVYGYQWATDKSSPVVAHA